MNTIEFSTKPSGADMVFALVLMSGIGLVIWMAFREGDPWGILIQWALAAAAGIVALAFYAEEYFSPNIRFKWSVRFVVAIISLLTGWYASCETTATLHSLLPVRDGDATSAMMTGRFLYFCGALVVWLPVVIAVSYPLFLAAFSTRTSTKRQLPSLTVPRRREMDFRKHLAELCRKPSRWKHVVEQLPACIAGLGRMGRLALPRLWRRLILRRNFVGVIFTLALVLSWGVGALVSVGRNDSLVSAVMADMLYSGDAYDPAVFPCNESIAQWIKSEADAGRHWKGFRQGAQDVLFVHRQEGLRPKKPYWRFSNEELKKVTQFEMVVRRCFEPVGEVAARLASSPQ